MGVFFNHFWSFRLKYIYIYTYTHSTKGNGLEFANSVLAVTYRISIQFSSIAESCPTPCDPMDCSMPDFPVHHQAPELQFSSDQLLSRVWLLATPWTAAHQASLSIINSRSLPKPMSTESVMPSNHLILSRALLLLPSIFPSIRVFSNESALHIRGQSIGVSGSTSVLPMNTQDWSPLG